MADVQVTQTHELPEADALERMKKFEEMLTKYGVKARWKGNQADLKGLGVSGRIEVSAADVQVVLKLGMMAKAAGVDVERLKGSVQKRLSAAFSS